MERQALSILNVVSDVSSLELIAMFGSGFRPGVSSSMTDAAEFFFQLVDFALKARKAVRPLNGDRIES